jgi:hypothetical protein
VNSTVGINNNSTVGINNNSTRIYKRSFHTTSLRQFDAFDIALRVVDLNNFMDLVNLAKTALETGLGEDPSIRDLVNFLSKRISGSTTGSIWGLDAASIQNEALMTRSPTYNSQDSLVIRDLERIKVDIKVNRDTLQSILDGWKTKWTNNPEKLKEISAEFARKAAEGLARKAPSDPMPTLGRDLEELLKRTNWK